MNLYENTSLCVEQMLWVLLAVILQVATVMMSVNMLELHDEEQLLCCVCSGLRLSGLGPGGGGGGGGGVPGVIGSGVLNVSSFIYIKRTNQQPR